MKAKIIALLAVLAVLFFFLGLNPLEAGVKQKFEEPFSQTEPLEPGGKVEVRNISGDIQVRTWEKNEVKIEALKVSRAESKEKAEENARKVKINVYREDGILKVKTEYPEKRTKNLNVSVDFTLTVPSGAPVKAASVSGDIRLEDIGGKAVAGTTSGDVEIHGAAAGARAASVSGDVTATDVKGGLYAKSVSGDIEADRVTGDTELSTVSGEVTAQGIEGDLEAGSVSGDIRLRDIRGAEVVKAKSLSGDVLYDGELGAGTRISLKAHSGDVVAVLPGSSAFDLEASTFSGDIESAFEVLASGKIEKKSLKGSVNGGGADVRLETFSGDITLKKK